MNKLPFDSGLIVTLSQMHKINTTAGCFVVANSTLLGYSFQCNIIDSQNMAITYSGDPTMMTLQMITYNITIKSVLNPPSVISLSYKIQTMIKSIINYQAMTTYSLTSTFNLTTNYSKNNNTFGQATNLSISITPNYYTFDVLKVYISKQLFVFQNILLTSFTYT